MTAPGYSTRCRPCNSAHRVEIDAKLLAGESTRAVSTWLAEIHGEKIPHQALTNHRAEHLDVRAEAAAQVAAAAPVFEAAVAKIVADVAVLDEVASIALDVARTLAPHVRNSAAKVSQPTATVFAAALANARAAVTDRHEMLHGKKLEVTDSASPSEDIDALHARVAAVLALPASGADSGAAGSADPGATG